MIQEYLCLRSINVKLPNFIANDPIFQVTDPTYHLEIIATGVHPMEK